MLKSQSKVGPRAAVPSAAPITTFYSYKGGVGRSMALANVAHLLADRYAKRVLIVDWDLEAPGLHRFFGIEDRNVKRGLLDLLVDYKDLLRTAQDSLPEPLVKLDSYLMPIRGPWRSGSLTLLSAGGQDGDYAARVNAFNWDDFYANWHGFGFITHLRTLLQQAADVVLVDSRTGVTDIGGICTLQLPDSVVLLFAMNEQNLAGTEFAIGKPVAAAAFAAARALVREPLFGWAYTELLHDETRHATFGARAAAWVIRGWSTQQRQALWTECLTRGATTTPRPRDEEAEELGLLPGEVDSTLPRWILPHLAPLGIHPRPANAQALVH